MKKNVLIGYPCYDHKCEAHAMMNIMTCIYNKNSPVKNVQMLNGDSLVSRARNKIASLFLHKHKDCDWLLFIDNDIIFNPKDINRLVSHGKKIIGGTYFKKKIPYSVVANNIGKHLGDGVYECQEVGTGFMLIHRDVFNEIIETHPELKYSPDSDEEQMTYYDFFKVGVYDNRYLSEDYHFLRLTKEQAHIDTKVQLVHVGRSEYPLPDKNYMEGMAQLMGGYSEDVPMPKDVFDKIEKAVSYQKENRKNWN